MRTLIFSLLLLPAPSWAQKKTIFVVTDAEGVAGICRQEQTDPQNQELRQLLTGEVNAAVDGFLAGGADEVIVWDGHDGSQTLSALTIHPKARLVIGVLPASFVIGYNIAFVIGLTTIFERLETKEDPLAWLTANAPKRSVGIEDPAVGQVDKGSRAHFEIPGVLFHTGGPSS